MIHFNKIHNILLFTLLLSACNNIVNYDDDYTPANKRENTGAPVIRGVYEVTDTGFTNPLNQAEIGQALCIAGENLNNLRELKFNTVAADVSRTFTAWDKAIVYVPETFILTHNDKIAYTTDKGTAEYSFIVNPGELQLDGLLNEFCQAGMAAAVAGKYFKTYGFGSATTSATLDGQALEISDVTDSIMSIVIPADADDNSVITFNWTDDQGVQQTKNVSFRPKRQLIFKDISTVQRDKESDLVTFESDADITTTKSSLGSKHIHLQGELQQWSNTELAFSQNMPDLGDLSNTDDYYLAFEVMTEGDTYIPSSTSTECDGFQIRWGWEGELCEWNPGNNGLNTHGEWHTVRLELSEVAPKGITPTGQWSTLYINYKPIVNCYANFRFGNFRIEKKAPVQEPLPPLELFGLQNEFCQAGEEVNVIGSGFKSYKFGTSAASVTMNGQIINVSNITDEYMTISIPTAATDNSQITFQWKDKAGQSYTKSVWYRPTNGIIFKDISAASRDKDNAAVTYETDADVTTARSTLGSTHLHYQGDLSAWAWIETAYSQNMPDLGNLSNTDDYYLAFEVMTEDDTYIPDTYMIRWGWEGDMCNWKPGKLNTGGEWQTIRLELSEVAPKGISAAGDWGTFHIVFQPNEAYSVNFRIGNFRIEKK